MTTTSESLVRKYYEMVDENDRDLVALFHQNATYKRPGYECFVGLAAIRQFYESDRVIAAGRHSLIALLVVGDKVGVEGTFAGVLKSGDEASLRFSDFFDLISVGGCLLIGHRRTYFDGPHV